MNVGKLKDIYAQKKQLDQMKKRMGKVIVSVREGDFEIIVRGDELVMGGNKVVEMVTENGEERNDIKDLFNKAVKESQKKVAKKMRRQLGGGGLPGF